MNALLERYANEIERFNDVYGLVSFKTHDELITRHILDSFAPLEIILQELKTAFPCNLPACWQIGDIGSGAGLPGIPLAIALGDRAHLTLMERMKRRVNFLCGTVAVLALKNVTVVDTSSEIPERQFHLLTFRAVSKIDLPFVEKWFKLLLPGGFIAAYKGKYETAFNEQRALKGNFESKLISYETPLLNEERTLLVIKSNFSKD